MVRDGITLRLHGSIRPQRLIEPAPGFPEAGLIKSCRYGELFSVGIIAHVGLGGRTVARLGPVRPERTVELRLGQNAGVLRGARRRKV